MTSSVNDRKPLWPIGSLVVLTGLNLLDYLDRQILAAVATPLGAELKLTDHQLSLLPTVFMWGYFLTSPIFGYLGDRLPRRWLVAMGVFVWSLGTLMTGHVSHFWALLIFRIFVGFGEASFGTISPGWIADLFLPGKRNNAISIFYLAIPIGSALGYILGGMLAARYGWRSAFLWAGYPGLLLAGLLFLLREPRRGISEVAAGAALPPAVSETTSGLLKFLRRCLERVLSYLRTRTGPLRLLCPLLEMVLDYLRLAEFPRYLLVIAGYTAQTFAMGGFAFWGPNFLQRIHGMDLEAANLFFGTALVVTGLTATLAGGFAATWWQRRTGRGYVWVIALSALMAGPTAMAAFLLPDLAQAKLALAVAMFFLFLTTGPVNTLILETVPVAIRATAVAGSIFAIHMFGDLWSTQLVGYLSDKWGDLQRACLWVLPVSLIVSAFFWCWLVAWTKREQAVRTESVGNA